MRECEQGAVHRDRLHHDCCENVMKLEEIILRNREWFVAMAGLDTAPESPVSLRSDLLTLVQLARKKEG
jgi:hypothetical protein